ncbi:MAG: NAD-dependent epimerase/dehydratase family protein [Cytophagaceae bacterium]|jgi:nucleoside-diphosphate-sugar epimerase|nr:NAD-dependent epimerase/dehydratase family protein [Cytophagaceae bacterium]
MKRWLVLGSGWLALPLAKRILERGDEVAVTTTGEVKSIRLQKEGYTSFVVTGKAGVWTYDTAFTDWLSQTDIIVYAIPPGTKRSTDSTHDTDIKALLDWVTSISKPLWVYCSTTSVYPDENRILDETWDTQSSSGNSVVAKAEQYIKESGVPYIIARLGGLCGPDRMLAKYFAGKSAIPQGTAPVNLIHLQDVVQALLFMVDYGHTAEIVNIVTPEHPTKQTFYTWLCDQQGLAKPQFDEDVIGGKTIEPAVLQRLGYTYIFKSPYEFTY